MAAILISRKLQYQSGAVPARILVDGRESARVRAGQSQTIPVTPGRHLVAAEGFGMRGAVLEVVVGADETVLVQLRVNLGFPLSVLHLAPQGGRLAVAPPPPVAAVAAGEWRVAERSRHEVMIGDETRQIDNWRGVSPVGRRFKIAREWTRSFSVDAERATTRMIGGGVGLSVLDLQAQSETALTEHYHAGGEERQLFEEEVSITTAPATRSRVVFSWKEIRQRGVVELVRGDDVVAEVPFEVVVGLSFDQQQVDEPAGTATP